jgi:4-hydroxy-tetrahydrodipicolinate reductase
LDGLRDLGDAIRVVHWGLGAMGAGMVRLVAERPGIISAGAIDQDPAKVGKSLREVCGLADGPQAAEAEVRVQPSLGEALAAAASSPGARGRHPASPPADVVLQATASFAADVADGILAAVAAGINVITIAEEMAYPWAAEPRLARDIDEAARRHGVTVLGTGVNPGFVLDTLIIALTGVLARVDSVRAARINDLSPFGPAVMRSQGVGATPAEFAAGVASGAIVGHVGFPESMHMIARALGWELAEIVEEREPIISDTYRETPHVQVAPGMVAGCRHVARAYDRSGRLLIELLHPQQIHPAAAGVATGDYIWLGGVPPINLAISPEIPGGTGTIAMAVNMIPAVVAARPGLLDMTDLPLPRAWSGDVASLLRGSMPGGGNDD